jgi:hypothetical protein
MELLGKKGNSEETRNQLWKVINAAMAQYGYEVQLAV